MRDLLRVGPNLKVHYKEDLGFYAENHVVVQCSTIDDVIAVVNEGVSNRKVASHNLNSESSRSHRFDFFYGFLHIYYYYFFI